jgi:hypothetical protein
MTMELDRMPAADLYHLPMRWWLNASPNQAFVDLCRERVLRLIIDHRIGGL